MATKYHSQYKRRDLYTFFPYTCYIFSQENVCSSRKKLPLEALQTQLSDKCSARAAAVAAFKQCSARGAAVAAIDQMFR